MPMNNPLAALAKNGRRGDTELGHLTKGEVVIPKEIAQLRPDLIQRLVEQVNTMGGDPSKLMVGMGSRNPQTGLEEFATQQEIQAAYKALGRDADAGGVAYWSGYQGNDFVGDFSKAAAGNKEQFDQAAFYRDLAGQQRAIQPIRPDVPALSIRPETVTLPGNPANAQVVTTSAPDYLMPGVLSSAQFLQDIAARPYTPYTGARVASSSPLESQAYNTAANYQPTQEFGAASGAFQSGIAGLLGAANQGYTPPAQFGQASNAANTAIQGLNNNQYNPSTFSTSFSPTAFNASYNAGTMGPGYQAGQATQAYNPTQFNSGYQAGQTTQAYNPSIFNGGYQAGQLAQSYLGNTFNSGYQAGQIGNTYDPTTFNSTYTGPGNAFDAFAGYQSGDITDAAYRAGQTEGGVFGAEQAQQYMDPYQQGVTDIAKREAERDFQKQQSQLRARVASAGAFGGSRATLLETENQRNQNQLLDDIQTKGLSSAFQNAQGQYERDRAARLNAFGLNEGARQTESQMLLDSQRAREAARLSGAQLGLAGTQAGEQARQQAAQLGLQEQQLGDQSRQFSARNLLDLFQANEQARQSQGQMTLQEQQLGDQSQQFSARNALDLFQANEQARQNQGQLTLQEQQLGDQSRQFGARNLLDVFQANEQARQSQGQMTLQEQQLGDASRQFGARNALDTFQANEQARAQQGTQDINRFQATEQARQSQSEQQLRAQQLADASRQFGFTSSLDAFKANEANRLNSAQLQQGNLQAALQGANVLGNIGANEASAQNAARGQTINAFQGALQGGSGLASLGAQIDNSRRANTALMGELGLQQRQQQQAALDAQYQQFLDERDYPLKIADMLTTGVSRLQGSNQSRITTQPEASTFEQVLGGAAGITGLLGSLGGSAGAAGGVDFLKGLLPDDIIGSITGFFK